MRKRTRLIKKDIEGEVVEKDKEIHENMRIGTSNVLQSIKGKKKKQWKKWQVTV